jgi:hypothetical protein
MVKEPVPHNQLRFRTLPLRVAVMTTEFVWKGALAARLPICGAMKPVERPAKEELPK